MAPPPPRTFLVASDGDGDGQEDDDDAQPPPLKRQKQLPSESSGSGSGGGEATETQQSASSTSTSALPEGFFANEKEDKKIRGVEKSHVEMRSVGCDGCSCFFFSLSLSNDLIASQRRMGENESSNVARSCRS